MIQSHGRAPGRSSVREVLLWSCTDSDCRSRAPGFGKSLVRESMNGVERRRPTEPAKDRRRDAGQDRCPHVDRRRAATGPSGPRHEVGFQTVQLFTKNNNQWKAPALTDAHVAAFRAALARDRGRRPGGPQLVPDQPGQPRRRALEEIDRRDDRRGRAVPGAGDRRPGRPPGRPRRAGRGRRAGPGRRGRSTRSTAAPAGRRSDDRPGDDRRAGDLPGHRFEHLGAILDRVAEPERLGVCVDTCHIFAAGYSLATAEEYDETMDAAGPDRRPRPGPGLAPQRQPAASAAAGSIATPGSAAVSWASSRSGTSSTTRGSGRSR